MKKKSRLAAAGSVAVLLSLAVGCGSNGDNNARSANLVQPAAAGKAQQDVYGSGSGYGSGGGADTGDAYGGSAQSAEESGPAGRLAVREIAGVGTVVTDSEGASLYRFDKDTAKPPKSACEGDCAKAWPPVPADGAAATTGIEAGLIGSVTRADGTKQLTLGGWPVYRYAKDTAPGEAKGEGVGGTWHALAPDGRKAVDAKQKPGGSGHSGMDMGGKPADSGSNYGGNGAGDNGGDSGSGTGAGSDKELSVASNEKLGKILVDGQWRTLYRFAKDSAWPMKIACVGACAETWKPAAPVDKTKTSGIRPELVGKVKRPDGTEQLTIDCWPVYTFTGDTAPGQTNGHKAQNLWFAVTDTGKKAA
ncbi:SCO0930 family lipoprotein [Streptomyces sp. NPDC089799]|uniref:SCO0930 family lipoprotein n=1 Tax=Streptomyces sp. NPDC089799 TaxID=3155066 RepID=UPI0034288A68